MLVDPLLHNGTHLELDGHAHRVVKVRKFSRGHVGRTGNVKPGQEFVKYLRGRAKQPIRHQHHSGEMGLGTARMCHSLNQFAQCGLLDVGPVLER